MEPARVLVELSPGSPDAEAYRRALARFDGRIRLTIAEGGDFRRALPEAEIVVAQDLSEQQLALAGRLRWLSSIAAGLDAIARPALLERGLLLTNASGVHGPNIAEHVLGMMLMFTRDLPRLFRAQLARRWERESSQANGPGELTGQTLVIVGLGRIGEAIAARARPFGLRVVAVKRSPSIRHDAAVPIDALVGLDGLDDVLGGADHVCLAVPLTPATHHLMNARRIARMRAGAYLYNIARGAIVDEPALIEALRTAKLGGAGLDVFEHEPLPPSSPLWDLPNVILTPHVAGLTPRYHQRAAALFAANLDRFLDGQPLENRFDRARGY